MRAREARRETKEMPGRHRNQKRNARGSGNRGSAKPWDRPKSNGLHVLVTVGRARLPPRPVAGRSAGLYIVEYRAVRGSWVQCYVDRLFVAVVTCVTGRGARGGTRRCARLGLGLRGRRRSCVYIDLEGRLRRRERRLGLGSLAIAGLVQGALRESKQWLPLDGHP